MQRLSLDEWKNIFRNVQEEQDEQMMDDEFVEAVELGLEEFSKVEVVWLETDDEWCLGNGTELFEDGFGTEEEALERLRYLESIIV